MAWTSFATLPSAISKTAMVYTDGRLFIFPSNGTAFYTWNSGNDTWDSLANLTTSVSGTKGAVAAHELKIYLVGGGTEFFFIYDVALDSWTQEDLGRKLCSNKS